MKYVVKYWVASDEGDEILGDFFFTEEKKIFESKKEANDFYDRQKNAVEVVKISKPEILK